MTKSAEEVLNAWRLGSAAKIAAFDIDDLVVDLETIQRPENAAKLQNLPGLYYVKESDGTLMSRDTNLGDQARRSLLPGEAFSGDYSNPPQCGHKMPKGAATNSDLLDNSVVECIQFDKIKCGGARGSSLKIDVSYGDGYTKATRKVKMHGGEAIVPVEAVCYSRRARVKLNEVGIFSDSWLGDCNIWADNKQPSGECAFRKKVCSITWREATVPVISCASVARGANAGSRCNLDTFKDITCSNYCADEKKKSCVQLGGVPNEQHYGWMKTVPDPCTCPMDSISNIAASEALCSKYYTVGKVCNSNTFNDISCSNYCNDDKKRRCKALGGVPNFNRYGWMATVPDPCTCPKNSAQPQNTCQYDVASNQCK